MDEKEEESKNAVQVEQSHRWRVDQFKEHGIESSRLVERLEENGIIIIFYSCDFSASSLHETMRSFY